jgi:uncharacterized protein (TIGR03437 family)
MRLIRTVSLCTAAFLAVVSLQAQTTLSIGLGRVIGQDSLTSTSASPNIVDGRSLSSPQGAALDRTSTPPALYVSDAGNHRVLGWSNAESFKNGAAADLIIGQADAISSTANGPTVTSQNKGLYSPTGLVVDSHGNLYVMDSGNNRILRFPRPFVNKNPYGADLVIGQPDSDGQPSYSTRAANQGGISAKSLYLYTSYTGVLRGSLAFDSGGNLWASDPGNHRVLRFPADPANVGKVLATADRVIGQTDFVSANTTWTINDFKSLRTPSGLAVDSSGNVYVTDAMHRLLVFTAPVSNGATAAYYAGAKVSMGAVVTHPPTADSLYTPEGVTIDPAKGEVLVSDTGNNRLLWFPALGSQWTATTSPTGYQWYGQASATTYVASVSATGLSSPVHAVATATEVYVVDSGNNRVVVFPQSSGTATRVLGQTGMDYRAPNGIEGKEVYIYDYATSSSSSVLLAGGVTVDTSGSVPRLYIADTWNNRVLGYCDARKAKQGDKADVVIGQPDLLHSSANGDGGTTPNSKYLYFPTDVVADTSGNLYVADLGNGRVLRFAAPCAKAQTEQLTANLVLGQADFVSHETSPNSSTMSAPYGLAFGLSGNNLLVSDLSLNRVLRFHKAAGSDFTNGQSASFVFGQGTFWTSDAGTTVSNMNGPRHIAVDRDGRLIVTDYFNGRVLFFPDADGSQNRVATLVLDHTTNSYNTLSTPIGVSADPKTGEVYVCSTGETRILKYPRYDQAAVSPYATGVYPTSTCFDIAHDARGNIYVADATNRIAEYFTATVPLNGGSFTLNRALTPGSLASAWITKVNPVPTSNAAALPLPTTLGGLQVYVSGTLAPMLFAGEVSSTQVQVNFQIPNSAPSSGTADFQIVDATTQEVLGAGAASMQVADPAFFTANSQGTGQISAMNVDSSGKRTCNGAVAAANSGCPNGSRPAKPGETLELYLTGAGYQNVSGWPKEGEASAVGVSTSGSLPLIWIGTGLVTNYTSKVDYSGVAPGFAGLWQVNVVVPNDHINDDGVHGNAITLKYREIFSQPGATILIQQK